MKFFLFYTDPGSGIMLLQVLLAFFAGGLFYFRNLIKSLFGFKGTAATASETTSPESKDDAETGV